MTTCGSLFSGIGGLDLGMERAGIKVLWQVEKDAECRRVLRQHWPETEIFTDVRDVGRNNLSAVDVICGGFPCQDVSVAGKRAGLDGARSGLWFEFQRIIEELRPAVVLIENVPGLLSSNSGRDFGYIVNGLVECGYCVAYRVLDSRYFGVPQRRRRVFIVGCASAGRAAEILFERESLRGHFETGKETREGTSTTTDDSVRGGDYFGRQRSDEYNADRVASTLSARDYKSATDLVLAAMRMQQAQGGISYSDKVSPALRVEQTPAVVGTLSARGADLPAPGNANELDFLIPVAIDARNLREQPDNLSGTLQSKENGSYSLNYTNPVVIRDTTPIHKEQWGTGFTEGASFTRVQRERQGVATPDMVRRLTPVECLRLQGFPDDWCEVDGKPLSDSAIYRMCGNAVTVNVAEWIARRIAASEA